jgi:hypothetical protein
MSSSESTPLARRELLRNGGIAISLAALLAACGDRSGSTAGGKLGVELLPDQEPADTTVDDAVILRTLQSLEYTTIEMHAGLADLGALPAEASDLIERFLDDHQRHADEIGELVTEAGGTPYECANTFMMIRFVAPLLAAVESSDDAERDAVEIANGFENLLAASYQALVEQLTDPALRPGAMTVGNDECRHAAALALAVNPDAIAPELDATGGAAAAEPATDDATSTDDATDTGGATDSDTAAADEFPTFYAIPAAFGQLTGITLVVGEADDEGARTTVQLQTPAANSFVYNDLSC